ncbi:MAG: hypothetical protein KBG17_07815 [Paludibacteraceae bacterium]|nr:hypothetical protein [Paludibacteraceae bacterium]
MQTPQQLFLQLVKDIKVELDDEFDRNFERKAFLNTAWKPASISCIRISNYMKIEVFPNA